MRELLGNLLALVAFEWLWLRASLRVRLRDARHRAWGRLVAVLPLVFDRGTTRLGIYDHDRILISLAARFAAYRGAIMEEMAQVIFYGREPGK